LTVERIGDTTAPAAVDFSTAPDAAVLRCDTVNGAASERCDFTTRIARLRFAAGETQKTVRVFITDDVYVEGTETFSVSLSAPSGGPALGTPATVVVAISDNDALPQAANPAYTPPFFVRMHYIDFLNREPEAAGFNAWVNALTTCAPSRLDCDRIGVSSGFFRSEEFFIKGYYVIRFYKVALGTNPNYRDFTRDSQRVTADTAAEVLAARDAFADEFVQRADFKAAYDGLSNQAYVDKLEQTAGVTLASKAQLVAALDAGTKTRAQVLKEVVESAEVRRKMYNDAFVSMQYFGYLRRDPEPQGFAAWLAYLNANPSDFRTMVGGFINSIEYRLRFGSVN